MRRSAAAIFAVPLLLGILTLVALVVGLVGDSGWDIAASIALAVPLIVTAAYLRPRSA